MWSLSLPYLRETFAFLKKEEIFNLLALVSFQKRINLVVSGYTVLEMANLEHAKWFRNKKLHFGFRVKYLWIPDRSLNLLMQKWVEMGKI